MKGCLRTLWKIEKTQALIDFQGRFELLQDWSLHFKIIQRRDWKSMNAPQGKA